MNPAFSVVIFTTIAGAAQGLVVALALAVLAGLQMQPGFVSAALILLVVVGAFFVTRRVLRNRPAKAGAGGSGAGGSGNRPGAGNKPSK